MNALRTGQSHYLPIAVCQSMSALAASLQVLMRPMKVRLNMTYDTNNGITTATIHLICDGRHLIDETVGINVQPAMRWEIEQWTYQMSRGSVWNGMDLLANYVA